MSKKITEKDEVKSPEKVTAEKITVDYSNEPLLEDLNFPTLLRDWRRNSLLADKYAATRDMVRASIASIIGTLKADKVTYTDSRGGFWQSTLVKPEDGNKLNQDKLKENMGKIGKLDAGTIAAILAASMDPVKKKQYALVTPPETALKAAKGK